MRLFIIAVKLAFTIYIAKYLSTYVISGRYLFIGILFAGSIYFLISSWKNKFILFSLMIFFPLKFPEYFKLPVKTVAEVMAPVLCFIAALEILKKGQSFFSRKAFIYFAAIGVLVLWSLIHYITNPVLGQKVFGTELQGGGIRNYYLLFAGVATFLCSYWFFKNNEINIDRWLLLCLISSLVIGNLFIIGTFSGYWYLNLSNFFALGPSSSIYASQYQSIPLRILATSVTAFAISLFHTRKWRFIFMLIFLNLLVFIILGGGRANLPAVFLSIIAYVVMIKRKYIFPVISVLLIVTGLYMLFLSGIAFSEFKYGRAFATEGGLKKQSEARYYSFLYMFDVFQSSPIFGKGIGYEEITAQEDFFKDHPEAVEFAEYVKLQSMSGGHGAYLSVLSIFGIGGLFWIMIMLFGSIYHSYGIIKKSGEFQHDYKLALMVFLFLISFAVTFSVGGSGYTNYKLWFLAGIIAGLLSKSSVQAEI